MGVPFFIWSLYFFQASDSSAVFFLEQEGGGAVEHGEFGGYHFFVGLYVGVGEGVGKDLVDVGGAAVVVLLEVVFVFVGVGPDGGAEEVVASAEEGGGVEYLAGFLVAAFPEEVDVVDVHFVDVLAACGYVDV